MHLYKQRWVHLYQLEEGSWQFIQHWYTSMYQNKDILEVLITDYNITDYFKGIISVETISLSSAR